MQHADLKRDGFEQAEVFVADGRYRLLPFRFARVPGVADKVLLTSEVGEWEFIAGRDFHSFVHGALGRQSDTYANLLAKHFCYEGNPDTAIRLLSTKYRTKKAFVGRGPELHIFVVSLRCDHSCHYCQVSRQSQDRHRFDMTPKTAKAAIDRLFESPSRNLTVEFQGGEPLLAFDTVSLITREIVRRNSYHKRNLTFTITSTLHHLTHEMAEFFREHRFQISTSLDGPEELHNANRPSPSRDSYQRTLAGVELARGVVGHSSVAALTTLTRRSLDQPEKIISTYVDLGFKSIFLRPLSPYGFAIKSEKKIGYSMAEFLSFYRRALSHILDLNRRGTAVEEAYAAVLLTHILTPYASGYVDLRSPAGAGLGVMVYNYDGDVYASDEARMLAEMGDKTFRLGSVHDAYAVLMRSDAMRVLRASGAAETLPGCADCAFLPYCGADPVFAHSRQGDPIGYRPTSDFCRKHMGLFEILFEHLAEADRVTMRTFLGWVTRQDPRRLYLSDEAA
jgi:His-Xaa-Ser system radical SAM maturase HxsB